ncbi:MAG TPA: M20/M25/M40 family metallo-hydrolase [Vicinamibacteria bacterium]|nr:M20/M25/M40 family metallo-hydrolase [Vicinamibacteria bacterium]
MGERAASGAIKSAGSLPLLLLAIGGTAEAQPVEDVRAWTRSHEAGILSELVDLLAIPNVASDTDGIERNARRLVALLGKRGFAATLLDGHGGPPAVLGELRTPGARRTLGVYIHYDGQPVEPEKWSSAPWAPMLRDGPVEQGGRERPLEPPLGPEWRLYARSASDDKAPIVGWLSALDALKATGHAPGVNLKLLLDGEEEAGSAHLPAVLAREKARLAADLWLLCDGPVHQTRRPQVFFGARGVMGVELTLYGPLRPLHSGHYGNWAPNPAAALARLIASARDDEGRVLVEGFYDDVRPPTEAERAALARSPDNDADLRRSLALGRTEGAVPLVEAILRPALNVRGIASGAVGEKAANAIPAEARASIDFRLVPDQRPERVRAAFEEHLRRQGFEVVHEAPDAEARRSQRRLVRLEWDAGYPAARAPLDSPEAKAVLAAVAEASGLEPVVMPTLGGSLPMYLFTEVLGAPVIGVPIANHDNNQHAADENLRLQNLWDGIAIYATLLLRVGD